MKKRKDRDRDPADLSQTKKPRLGTLSFFLFFPFSSFTTFFEGEENQNDIKRGRIPQSVSSFS